MWIAAGVSLRAAWITWASSGWPASGCSTFGSADFMRLPSPAARITTETGARAGAALLRLPRMGAIVLTGAR